MTSLAGHELVQFYGCPQLPTQMWQEVYAHCGRIERFVAELAPPDPTLAPAYLIERFCHLNTYAIIQAQTKDYLRQTQSQSILRPILAQLRDHWDDPTQLSQHLRQILAAWQTLDPIPAGYLTGNILNLLVELELS